MTVSIAESVTKEAIAMLIDLAERGEIDPWDVQVIDVVDRFLARLFNDDRRDLYESGHALLYASMLILLKANSLSQAQMALEEGEAFEGEDPEFLQEGMQLELPYNFEQRLQRRPVALPPQQRRITLQELIAQLEAIAVLVDQKSDRKLKARQPKVNRQAAIRAIAKLAHKENLSEIIMDLDRYFAENPDIDIEISDLAEIFNDKIGVFWGLLFLSSQSKVELSQTEFYGKIQVTPLQQDRQPHFSRDTIDAPIQEAS
ncbi:segregation/condensation protein A [Pseudanabaena sp. PCC 6802]|uniref:segregation/condensation protein A n=1 Tax=Pseudanabaena sp. PCC 6802 TaxID=118173 RepID=UPI00034C80E1|nr:segregation/condensation protein A [Pseudanabaena sp. PCC 6802]